jgi:hypothetical protein
MKVILEVFNAHDTHVWIDKSTAHDSIDQMLCVYM